FVDPQVFLGGPDLPVRLHLFGSQFFLDSHLIVGCPPNDKGFIEWLPIGADFLVRPALTGSTAKAAGTPGPPRPTFATKAAPGGSSNWSRSDVVCLDNPWQVGEAAGDVVEVLTSAILVDRIAELPGGDVRTKRLT